MLVSTRTPDDITIQYLKCIRRVATKTTISFVRSACQFVRPRDKTTLFPGINFVLFYNEKFYYNSIEKIQIGLTF